MALHIVAGDLMKSDATVIAHQTNCFKTPVGETAKKIMEAYREARQADEKFPQNAKERLGKCSGALSKDKKRFIVNLYGQYSWGSGKRHTKYESLESALRRMIGGLGKLEAKGFAVKIGVPYLIGCEDAAGGAWEEVREILERVSEEFGRDIYAYRTNWQAQKEQINESWKEIELEFAEFKKRLEHFQDETGSVPFEKLKEAAEGKYESAGNSAFLLVNLKDGVAVAPFIKLKPENRIAFPVQSLRMMEQEDWQACEKAAEEYERKAHSLKRMLEKHKIKTLRRDG